LVSSIQMNCRLVKAAIQDSTVMKKDLSHRFEKVIASLLSF
jgi:hypothetical protein